ncbi:MAG TPA: ABC transporter ATP-binding protein, partial [Acholeplasmataceae bacterium]|nr:ABC transporter ATP-binding protein [Acholeplasmataceae bacterium]
FRVTKDLYRFLPFEITIILIINIIQSVIAIFQVSILAELLDIASKYFKYNLNKELLYKYSIIFILSILLPILLNILSDYIVQYRIYMKNYLFIDELNHKLNAVPLIHFDKPNFYNEITRAKKSVNGNYLINYYNSIMNIFPQLFRLVGIVIVLLDFNFIFLPLAFISIIPIFITQYIFYKALYLYNKIKVPQFRTRDYLWGLLTGRNTIKEFRVLNAERYVKNKWVDVRDECLNEEFALKKKYHNIFMLCHAFELFFYSICIVLAIFFLINNEITIGQFSSCLSAFLALQLSASTIIKIVNTQVSNTNFVADYYDFIDFLDQGELNHNSLETSNKLVELKNVSFYYPQSEKKVLDKVSLSINKGELIVIVGENGSGKTTLSKIITNAYYPSEGNVSYLNGNTFSIVAQNFVKYQLSLRENIALSDIENINDDRKIKRILNDVGINLLSEIGLDDMLGKELGGRELSGGEWQKFSIGRGLFKDSSIIVVDEPTSAIDPLLEHEILSKFIELAKSRTVIVISHRVGICKYADRIIVLKEGQIVGKGSHSELVNVNPEYTKLWEEQAKWYR